MGVCDTGGSINSVAGNLEHLNVTARLKQKYPASSRGNWHSSRNRGQLAPIV